MPDKADYPVSAGNHHHPPNHLIPVGPAEERFSDFGGTAIFLLIQERGTAFYTATGFPCDLGQDT